MSKAIAVPIALLAAPALVAVGALSVVGMGALWTAKKGKEFWDGLSPEERRFLLPLGADRDRLQLEAATVSYQPIEGLEFATSLPSFGMPETDGYRQGFLPAPSNSPADAEVVQMQALGSLESEAKALGFDIQRRSISPDSDLIILDLASLTDVRQVNRVPIPVR